MKIVNIIVIVVIGIDIAVAAAISIATVIVATGGADGICLWLKQLHSRMLLLLPVSDINIFVINIVIVAVVEHRFDIHLYIWLLVHWTVCVIINVVSIIAIAGRDDIGIKPSICICICGNIGFYSFLLDWIGYCCAMISVFVYGCFHWQFFKVVVSIVVMTVNMVIVQLVMISDIIAVAAVAAIFCVSVGVGDSTFTEGKTRRCVGWYVATRTTTDITF